MNKSEKIKIAVGCVLTGVALILAFVFTFISQSRAIEIIAYTLCAAGITLVMVAVLENFGRELNEVLKTCREKRIKTYGELVYMKDEFERALYMTIKRDKEPLYTDLIEVKAVEGALDLINRELEKEKKRCLKK